MGFLNEDEAWEHVSPEKAKDYLKQFKEYHEQTGARWKRYVDSEHVKAIAERGFFNYWFVRSIFRSVAQYSVISQLSGPHWWYGYVFEFDPSSNDFVLVDDCSTLSDSEFRKLYHQCGGCSNF